MFILSTNIFADESPFLALSDDLIAKATVSIEASKRPEDGPKPSWWKNHELRGSIKDIRKLAKQFRKRVKRGRARTLVSKIKLKRIIANMETGNYMILNGGAEHLEAFPATWKDVRDAIGALASQMCCGTEE